MVLRNSFKLMTMNRALLSGPNGMTLTRSFYSFSPNASSEGSARSNPKDKSEPKSTESSSKPAGEPSRANKAKSVAQADAELRERMENMSGEGGAAGIEYEDGKPNAMKRGVRNNMFRLI